MYVTVYIYMHMYLHTSQHIQLYKCEVFPAQAGQNLSSHRSGAAEGNCGTSYHRHLAGMSWIIASCYTKYANQKNKQIM